MAVNTSLLDFSIDPSVTKNDSSIGVLFGNIEEIIRDFLSNLKMINKFNLAESLVKIYTANSGALLTIRIFKNGLITLNIDDFREESDGPLISFLTIHRLEKTIKDKIVNVKRTRSLPPMKRGTFMHYYLTSDDRLLEYDIDSRVFEEDTPYQKVEIVHSKTLGNILLLDDVQNLAESDLIYTETLMQRGKENYEGKDIVILGGGDGALLYELLKEKPKEVIMLELDDVVMKACAKHMRSVCGDVLDNYNSSNYKIIVGDCMKAMEQYVQEGRKFDYVFADLTDIPISENRSQELWTFLDKALQLTFKVLKPNGKYMTHLTGTGSPQAIETYKQHLQKISPPVTVTLDSAFVPSFLEDWVFCQASFSKKE